ncbi:MAG: hypothetical protein GY929_16805 [Actinomycetia bacterium]|nr:hypothetical protein [Actinomycetes bacterium]
MSPQRRRQVGFDAVLSMVLIATTVVYAPKLWYWLPRALAGQEAYEAAVSARDEPPNALGFVTTIAPTSDDADESPPEEPPQVDETEPEVALNRRLAPDRVLRLREDTTSTFELGIVDGRPAPVDIVVQPQIGTVTRRGNGEWSYTPDPDANGLDEFLYRVCLGEQCEDGFVLLAIAGANDPPVAEPDSVTVAVGQVALIEPTANDIDPDALEGGLSITAVGVPLQGSAVLHPDGTIEYRAPGLVGDETVDTFTYVVCDPPGGCSSATVTVHLTP